MAVNEALRFAFASLCFDRAWNLMKFGIAIAARMPMIATTIISSMSVKPFWTSFFIGFSGVDSTMFPFVAIVAPQRKARDYSELEIDPRRWSETTRVSSLTQFGIRRVTDERRSRGLRRPSRRLAKARTPWRAGPR